MTRRGNKILLALSCVTVLPVTGCSFLSLTKLVNKTIGVYSLLGDVDSGKSINSYKVDDYQFKIVEGEDLVPYISLEGYSKLIEPHLKEGYVSDAYSDSEEKFEEEFLPESKEEIEFLPEEENSSKPKEEIVQNESVKKAKKKKHKKSKQ